jgi:hypothetical protein
MNDKVENGGNAATKGALPEALRLMLSKVRADLKSKSSATVKLTMAEVRGIYALSSKLHAAQVARDDAKKDLRALRRENEKLQRQLVTEDLLRNGAVVALLISIERIVSGEETSPSAIAAARAHLQKYIERARGADKKRAARRRARPNINPSK